MNGTVGGDDPALAAGPKAGAVWTLGPGRRLGLDSPRVMAILNLTPDSFHDGGRLLTADDAVRAAESAVRSGADVLDLGAESTRPGSSRVDADEQRRRLIPVVRAIAERLRGLGPAGPGGEARAPLMTVDTTLSVVAREAFEAGADALNDVSACTEDAGMLPLLASMGRGVVLMHRGAPPEADRYSTAHRREPEFAGEGGVVGAVRAWLKDRMEAAVAAGVAREGVVLDPGLGFGKSVAQNLALIRATPALLGLGRPVLSALSRKSFTTVAAGLEASAPTSERLHGTLGLSVAHLGLGARLFRVHDVRAHAEALRAAWSVGGGAG